MSASDAPPPPAPERRFVPLLGLCVLLLAGIGLCVVYALPRFRQMLQPNPQQETLAQARRIYNACQAFNAVRGKLPGTLEFLVPDFLAERRDLADPGHPESGDIGYFYYGTGKTSAEPVDSIFLASKAEEKGYRVIVRFDGQTKVQYLPAKLLRREAAADEKAAEQSNQ
jgi:hypothetical protein